MWFWGQSIFADGCVIAVAEVVAIVSQWDLCEESWIKTWMNLTCLW